MSEKRVCIKKFNSENAAIKAKFDTTGVVLTIVDELKKQSAKAGIDVTEDESAGFAVEGNVVLIDEGSRFLRYFIGPFGVGSTKLEVEGHIKQYGKPLQEFHFREKGLGGFGGGNSEGLLKNSAKRVAKKITKIMKKI